MAERLTRRPRSARLSSRAASLELAGRLAPKSRASCDAFFEALEDVKRTGNLPIPMQLRNAPTKLMKELGYGKSDGEESLLPEALKNKTYYPK